MTVDYLFCLFDYSLFFVVPLLSVFLDSSLFSAFLFNLFMNSVLVAESAKFFQLKLVLLHLFIPCGRVIPPLAFGALKGDYLSHLLPI